MITAAADDNVPPRNYIGGVERPFNTALGWRLPNWLLDYGPVSFIGLIGIGLTWHHHERGAVVALLITVAALAARVRHPIAALAAVLAIALVADTRAVVMLPVMLALYTVVETAERPVMVGAIVLATAVVLVCAPVHGDGQGFGAIVSRLVAIGLAVAAALYVRTRADYIVGLRERAARLERERELLADQAVNEERVRIARELHDVVAHNVSLMVVQAQALLATGADASQAEPLGRVADLGREAMSEMHRMLGVLRLTDGGSTSADREPQPGVGDLVRLVSRTREAGLDVALEISGAARDLPPGVDLSVYRIAQEALTNVIRHAAARHATVRLQYGADQLELTIRDDGRGSAAGPEGHGLVGMRERVALFGGSLAAGPLAGGSGYQVHATIPVH